MSSSNDTHDQSAPSGPGYQNPRKYYRQHLALARLTLDEIVSGQDDIGWAFLEAINELVLSWQCYIECHDRPADMAWIVAALGNAVDEANIAVLHGGEVLDATFYVSGDDEAW